MPIENKIKSKGLVETPDCIVEKMHKFLELKDNDSIFDLTAGKGKLFFNHIKQNCYGCEIDKENYSFLLNEGFKNIIYGDIFEIENQFNDNFFDAVILNPPYQRLPDRKTSVDIMNIAVKKLKDNGKFAIINQKNFYTKYPEQTKYFIQNTSIGYGAFFGNDLFKPFANIETFLLMGFKNKENVDCILEDYKNENIQLNKRAKFINPKLLNPCFSKKIKSGDFWQEVENYLTPKICHPTEEDFIKVVDEYMAFETGLPVEMIRNPRKLWQGLNKIYHYFD